MTESSAIQTIREFGYFLVTDGLSGNVLLKRGKDSTVEEEGEEEEEEEEEEVGKITKNDEVEWRERVVEGERKIGEEEEDWEGGLEEVEEQRMEMEMTVKRKKKKKWKKKKKTDLPSGATGSH